MKTEQKIEQLFRNLSRVNSIFTVTTLHFKDKKYGSSPRCVGWYPTFELADYCVTTNLGDIHETTYTYALIEETEPGLYPSCKEHWYEWINGTYKPCNKPKHLKGMIGSSIG